MRSCEVIRVMLRNSARGHRQLSRELGRSEGYIDATLSRGLDVRVETLARIANACGYTLFVEDEKNGRRYELG